MNFSLNRKGVFKQNKYIYLGPFWHVRLWFRCDVPRHNHMLCESSTLMLKDNGGIIPADTSAFSFSLCQSVYVSSFLVTLSHHIFSFLSARQHAQSICHRKVVPMTKCLISKLHFPKEENTKSAVGQID